LEDKLQKLAYVAVPVASVDVECPCSSMVSMWPVNWTFNDLLFFCT